MRIWVYLWIVVLGAGLLAVRSCHKARVRQAQLDPRTWTKLFENLRDGDPHPFRDKRRFVWDEACYIRPRSDMIFKFRIGPAGGGKEVPYQVRQVEHGLLHASPLPETIQGPTVLLVGDSHMYGFTDIQFNASTLVEDGLRAAGYPDAIVLNASCPYYNPYQYALRVATLWDTLSPTPRVVIAVVFIGNDFLEMENTCLPYLDDDLLPQSMSLDPPAETTSARRLIYNAAKPRLFGELFWQGMNQAIYLHEHPERYSIVLAKVGRAIEMLREDCKKHDAKLIVAIIPTYSDVVDLKLPFADHERLGPIVREKVDRKLRQDFARMVTDMGLPLVDAFPIFQQAGVDELYCNDFHIWKKGHRLLGEALLPIVERALAQTTDNP